MDSKYISSNRDHLIYVLSSSIDYPPSKSYYDNNGEVTDLGREKKLPDPIAIFTFFNQDNEKRCRYVYKIDDKESPLQVLAPDGSLLSRHSNLKSLRAFMPYRKGFKLIHISALKNEKLKRNCKSGKFSRRGRHYKKSKKVE